MVKAGAKEQDLYAGTAPYYAAFRFDYPKQVIDCLLQCAAPTKTKALLDLGCGTGKLTFSLAPHFQTVMACDASGEMVSEAKRQSELFSIPCIKWEVTSAETYTYPPEKFDLITIARAFHWMEKERLLPKLYASLRKEGVLALIGERESFFEGKEEWKKRIHQTIDRFLGKERIAAKTPYIGKSKVAYEQILSPYGFAPIKRHTFPIVRTWSLQRILGFLSSTANCSERMLGADLSAFREEIAFQLQDFKEEDLREEATFEVIAAYKP